MSRVIHFPNEKHKTGFITVMRVESIIFVGCFMALKVYSLTFNDIVMFVLMQMLDPVPLAEG